MVRYKTPDAKKRRFTYAERTITAISDVRERHPRSPIHLKTLKAQIRRNAEAQQDLLGPRWRSGIDLACKALTDQGVLDAEHPPGRVVLTQKGKQLLTRTRHSVGLLQDHEHNPECRENLGRKVIHRLSYPSAKSRRASSVTTLGEYEAVNKPPSKMTRTELLEEYRSLRKEYNAFKRDTSTKIAELSAELEIKEDEMLDLLSEAGESESEIEVNEPSAATDSGRSASATHQDKALPSASPDNELIRTDSGTYISRISRRPTPAPSDAGAEHAESHPASPTQELAEVEQAVGAIRGERDFDIDMNEADMSFDADITLVSEETSPAIDKSKAPAARSGIQTSTPLSSPRLQRRHLTEADKQIEKLVKERQAEKVKFENELRELRERLESSEVQHRALEEEKTKLQGDAHRLKMELLEKTADLESVQQLLREKGREAETHANSMAAEKALSNDLEKRLTDVQKQVQDSESARHGLQSQLDQTRAEIEEAKKVLQGTIQDLQKNLTDICKRETTLTEEVKAKQAELASLHVELQASTEQVNEARAEVAILQARLHNETMDKARLESEVAAAQERDVSLEQLLSSLTNDLEEVRRGLQVERDGATVLHRNLQEVTAQRDGLLLDLEARQAALRETQAALTHKEADLLLAQNQLSSNESITTGLRTALATLQARVQDATTQKTLLEEALKDAEEEVTELKEGYAKLKRVQLAEFEDLDRKVTKKRKRASMPVFLTMPTTIDIDMDGEGESDMPL